MVSATPAPPLANVVEETENLAAAKINTAVVGFGIDDASQINAVAAKANELGNADDTDALYALHEEVGGVGVPFIANNETELINTLSTIVDNVKASLFHGAAPAPTTTADLGNMLLVASFDATDWSGDLKAITQADDGDWDVTQWTASEEIPDTRSIFTVDPDDSETVIEYTNYLTDYMPCKDLGDIINSTPIVVNNPSSFYNFNGYEAWARTIDRDSRVYIGANDGALHAFSLADGSEQWAFVPESLQAKLELADSDDAFNMCDVAYCHQYFVDGSPKVADVYTKNADDSYSWENHPGLRSGRGRGILFRPGHHLCQLL